MPEPKFIFVWKIKNFQYYWQKDGIVEIVSPEFAFNIPWETKWRLRISDRHHSNNTLIPTRRKYVLFFLRRIDNNALDVKYCIQISFVKDDKSLHNFPCRYENFNNINEGYIKVSRNEILYSEMKDFFREDILTVRCKIDILTDEIKPINEQCFAHTYLAVERMFLVAVVEEFSDLIPGLKRTARIKWVSVENRIFSITICLSDEGELVINIPIESEYFKTGFCKVYLLDKSWNWRNCSQDNEWRESGEIWNISLTLDFKTLMDHQKYLQNNVLTLKLEIDYTDEAEPQRIETIKYGFDYLETFQQITPCLMNPPAPETETARLKSPTTVTDDLISLYREQILCDTKLRAETETFPAHKAVLSARSPVFKKMFTTDMREKTNDCIYIADLNADTVRKLLMFMYTDIIEGLDWQTSMDMYFAADKYDIASLMLKCSNFLKLNILPTNCYELLLLSEMHQDNDLKEYVQDYILARDQDVFGSKEWKTFMRNHLQLAADTMCLKYTRK